MTEEIVEMYETIAQPIRTIRAFLKAQKKRRNFKKLFSIYQNRKTNAFQNNFTFLL